MYSLYSFFLSQVAGKPKPKKEEFEVKKVGGDKNGGERKVLKMKTVSVAWIDDVAMARLTGWPYALINIRSNPFSFQSIPFRESPCMCKIV